MGLMGRISRKRCGEFWGKQWNVQDVVVAALFLATHCLCLLAPFYFTWGSFWLAVALIFVTGFGITLSYHRHLAHKSFKLPKWLEYLFAYCGALAVQGSPIEWVSSHRYHHQFTETAKDPHSPVLGFWHSHIGWVFDSAKRFGQYGGVRNVEDLMKQPFYRFLRDTYLLHTFALGGLLYAVGGLPFIVWGMGVRTVYIFHSTFLINSVGHMWGKQPWTTGDLSRNNWLLALLGFGEGWHNNHHAFDYSARHGLEWWQIDVTWYVILFLEAMGLATDVKFPTEIQKLRRASKNIGGVMDTPN